MSDTQSSSHSDLVTVENGVPMTTSLVVAEKFDRRHKNVVQAIQNLECSEEFGRLNFQPISYADTYGRQQTCYRMTRDGFSFLCMGFTGKKAAQWKEAYIKAFNAMEATLKSTATHLPLELAIRLALDLRKLTPAQIAFVERLSGVVLEEFHHNVPDPRLQKPPAALPQEQYLSVRDLGRPLRLTAQQVNYLLEKAGLQQKSGNYGWWPTQAGESLAHVVTRRNGGWLRWLPEARDIIKSALTGSVMDLVSELN